jgi:hypothetical protein
MMLATVAAIVVPYLYSELRAKRMSRGALRHACNLLARCGCCWPPVLPGAAVRDAGTSLKDMDAGARRQPAVPAHRPSLRRLGQGLGHMPAPAPTAAACKPFFMNSVLMVVPAVLVSTAMGRSTATC